MSAVMGKSEPTEQVAFRFSRTLIRRIDRHAQRLREVTGMHVTRADAVRSLLQNALKRAEQGDAK